MISSTPPLPKRKNLRAEFHDYSGGIYFITICTCDKRHYFGEIIDGEMKRTILGEILERNITDISTHFKDVEIPLFVVMPNHFHAIVCINSVGSRPVATASNVGRLNQTARLAVATGRDPTMVTHHNSRLAVVVGSIKAHVTRYAVRNHLPFKWQPRFHDHIIRDSHDGNKISEYITNNIARWDIDRFNDKKD